MKANMIAGAGPGEGAKPVLLVVDDEACIRRLVERIARAHFRVVCAGDAEEGLALAASEKPDVLVTDYQLPGMKGDELCAAVRDLPGMAGIRIVLMSGSLIPADGAARRKLGIDAFVAKPFVPEILLPALGVAEQSPASM